MESTEQTIATRKKNAILGAVVVVVVLIVVITATEVGLRRRTTWHDHDLKIACEFIYFGNDLQFCREVTAASIGLLNYDSTIIWTTIPTEIGLLTQLTNLYFFSIWFKG